MQEHENLEGLEIDIQFLCKRLLEIYGYWFAFSCFTGDTGFAEFGLFNLSSVYLRSSATAIILPNAENFRSTRKRPDINVLWAEWGKSVWSVVEALLGSDLHYWVDHNLERITRRDVFMKAYGEDSRDIILVDIAEGEVKAKQNEVLAYLMDALWKKEVLMANNLIVSRHWSTPENEKLKYSRRMRMRTFSAERVYLLMAFMLIRIYPNTEESEIDALNRLLRANGIDSEAFLVWLRQWCKHMFPNERHMDHLFQ